MATDLTRKFFKDFETGNISCQKEGKNVVAQGHKGWQEDGLCPSFCFALAYARPFSSVTSLVLHVRNCIADDSDASGAV